MSIEESYGAFKVGAEVADSLGLFAHFQWLNISVGQVP